jgi:hypothetical protein
MKGKGRNILYYNSIADEYNDMLDKNPDKIIREKVAKKFCDIVKDAVVIDFGGGTGLDLPWLAANNRTVFFCEPSVGMKQKAIASRGGLLDDHVIFLNDLQADFRHWKLKPPFAGKADAVLANFAVLNCIPDIKFLFQNLAGVINRGANVVALVLTSTSKKMSRNLLNILRSFFYREPATIKLNYKNNRQTVYIHSLKDISKASKEYFDFCSSQVIPGSEFILLHLKRK